MDARQPILADTLQYSGSLGHGLVIQVFTTLWNARGGLGGACECDCPTGHA